MSDGGWVLPEVVDPPRVCVSLYIPDDFHHKAAFWGALWALSRWYNWQKDDEHTAIAVGNVWKEIWREANDRFYSGHGCDMGVESIQFRQDTLCGLEVSINGGAWQSIYDASQCVASGIQNAIEDGTIAAPGQPSAGGVIPSDDCQSWNIELRGNDRWHCPVTVKAGYTITVENATGGWSDGSAITALWACPDGKSYAFGACGAYHATQPTDPLQSVAHLGLIGYCDGIYMNMYNTQYIVPVGTPDVSFFLQANDGNIADNGGSIRCKVTICNFNSDVYAVDYRPVTITPIGKNKWHIDVPYNNDPVGGNQPRTTSALHFQKSPIIDAQVKAVITNLTGWENAPSYTNNGSLQGGTPTGSAMCPFPLGQGEIWSDWGNAQQGGNQYWWLWDIRTLPAFSYDIEVTEVKP